MRPISNKSGPIPFDKLVILPVVTLACSFAFFFVTKIVVTTLSVPASFQDNFPLRTLDTAIYH